MVTFAEAERILRALPPCAAAVEVALAAACGRIAAEAVRAPADLPRLPRSAMDGYALRADDPSPSLRCVGTRYAGDAPGTPPGPGECVAVATGAALPPGTNAVVPRERTRADGRTVHLLLLPSPGENVIAPGEEGRAGDLLVTAGERVGPRQLAALAAHGIARLRVREALRVALAATGDEVVPVGAPARAEQVHESGALALEAELRGAGLQVHRFGPVPDREDELAAVFGGLLAAGAHHAVVTTGGVSVGERDLVPAMWERLGAERLFWRVAVHPGRALYAAAAGPVAILSLSGTPQAALAAFYSLVRPALAALAGERLRERPRCRLAAACARRRDRSRLVWAELGPAPGYVRPLVGLSVLQTLVRATALLLIPPGHAPLLPDDVVELVPLDAAGGGAV